jgi:hypothetical protein
MPTDNRDPYNPTATPPYDKYGNARFEPVEGSGRGAYVLLALLVAIGVIGGLLYFNHDFNQGPGNPQQAQVPPAPAERTVPMPAPPPGAVPRNVTPATPSHPDGMTDPTGGTR